MVSSGLITYTLFSFDCRLPTPPFTAKPPCSRLFRFRNRSAGCWSSNYRRFTSNFTFVKLRIEYGVTTSSSWADNASASSSSSISSNGNTPGLDVPPPLSAAPTSSSVFYAPHDLLVSARFLTSFSVTLTPTLPGTSHCIILLPPTVSSMIVNCTLNPSMKGSHSPASAL